VLNGCTRIAVEMCPALGILLGYELAEGEAGRASHAPLLCEPQPGRGLDVDD
jgi:hypothetical protein